MNREKFVYGFAIVMLTALLTACGGGGGGDSTSAGGSTLTSVSAGVAVDPYIVGAIVEEISVDGRFLQSSSETNTQGEFIFEHQVAEGSMLRLKASAKGRHGNADYTGMVKRKASIDDGYSVVLSPLTTLVANGMSVTEVSRLMADAGLPGLTEEDIYTDPVVDLKDRTGGVNNAMLRNLQANMAANSYMAAIGNFNYNGGAMANLDMSTMVAAVQRTLNADHFNQLTAEIGNGFSLGDFANTAARINNTIVDQIRNDLSSGSQKVSASRLDQIIASAMINVSAIAQEISQLRNENGGSVTPPDSGTPPTTNPASGTELYLADCQGCHGNLQTTRISNRTAAGIEAAIAGVSSMTDITLTFAEIQLIADVLPVPEAPPVDPSPSRNGQAVYAQECSACHKLASHDSAGNIDLAGIGNIIVPKIEAGHMNMNLSTQELNAVADFADSFAPPAPPVVPRNSQAIYDSNCSRCHKLNGYDTVGNLDLAGKGSITVTKVPAGHGGSVSTVELTSLAAWLDSWAPVLPPVVARDGQAVYDNNCSGCHKLYGYDAAGNIDLASMGSSTTTKLGAGHGGSVSSGEITNVANWLDSWALAPPPVVDRNGETIYNGNCTACHKLYNYDAAGNIDLASKGGLVPAKLGTGHGGALTSGEVANIASWLNTWASEPPPVVARSGETVYTEICAACHKLNGYDASGNIDLASMGNATIGKLATGHGGMVSPGEITNVANWLNSWALAPPPVVTRNGETVYNNNCAGCHKVNTYDAVGNIDLAGQGALVRIKLGTGHGGTVTTDEQTNLVNWLNIFQASDPYAGACDTCHGQPPGGSSSPNKAGAHGVHATLASVANNCSTCHTGASHNAQVDLDFATTWNAKSGTATSNSNGTCSNISCHGGVTTPSWNSGLINVNTQCSSCHTYGTSQYNGYSSGEHNKHVRDKKYACSTCHDAAKLQNGHFSNLSTRTFEQAPSSTIKSSLSYSGGRCATPSCHGGENW